MKINPTTLSWEAPSTDAAGEAIDYELEYEVGITSERTEDYFAPLVTIPGQLREGKTYEAPISDLLLDYGTHTIALRSFAKEMPDLMSEWSEPVSFRLVAVPSAPLDLRVT
ncbi:MAG: hypothetical protein ACI92N_002188 [Pseudomonadales bacterium]|jgi:hypothetical protein